MSKEKRGEGKPKCSANLILPWATKFWIGLALKEPNNDHCVHQDDTSHHPHSPGERLGKRQW